MAIAQIVLPALALLSVALITNRILAKEETTSEPFLVRSPIPYVGHLIGLFWYKNHYYTKLRTELPIYSLTMPGSRLYILNSPDLVLSLQRQPNVVSFWFIEAQFTARLGGMSREASEKLQANLRKGENERSLLIRGLKATHQAMMPGEGVNWMIRVAAQTIVKRLDAIKCTNKTQSLNLWHWVRHEITIITTESVYGPLNPYRDPEIESAFWDFADDCIMLLAGVMPTVLASKGFRGREKVVDAMGKYFEAKAHLSGSALVQARYNILGQELDIDQIARFECVNGIALLLNTVPAAFWTVYHVFSNPEILATVREQASALCINKGERGILSKSADLAVQNDTPLLTAMLHESLRHRGSGTGPRYVTEDIILDDQYLLRKGSFVIIPQRELNFNTRAWGGSCQEFEPRRFLKTGTSKIHPGAFRGWGGGANLCAGKGFATKEINALLAMLAVRYDLIPESGHWDDPGQDLSNITLAISPPKVKVPVVITPRKGAEPSSWAFRQLCQK